MINNEISIKEMKDFNLIYGIEERYLNIEEQDILINLRANKQMEDLI